MDQLKECTVWFFFITWQFNLALLDSSCLLSWRIEVTVLHDQCKGPVAGGDTQGASYQPGNFFWKGVWLCVFEITALASYSPSLVLSVVCLCSPPSPWAAEYPLCQGGVLVGDMQHWIQWAGMFLPSLREKDVKAGPCFLFGVTTLLCLYKYSCWGAEGTFHRVGPSRPSSSLASAPASHLSMLGRNCGYRQTALLSRYFPCFLLSCYLGTLIFCQSKNESSKSFLSSCLQLSFLCALVDK